MLWIIRSCIFCRQAMPEKMLSLALFEIRRQLCRVLQKLMRDPCLKMRRNVPANEYIPGFPWILSAGRRRRVALCDQLNLARFASSHAAVKALKQHRKMNMRRCALGKNAATLSRAFSNCIAHGLKHRKQILSIAYFFMGPQYHCLY